MRPTVVGLVTPHLLRVVDLAHEAERGVNVDWHLRDTVGKSMSEMAHLYNADLLIDAYIESLETAVAKTPRARGPYTRVLEAAAAAARKSAQRD